MLAVCPGNDVIVLLVTATLLRSFSRASFFGLILFNWVAGQPFERTEEKEDHCPLGWPWHSFSHALDRLAGSAA